MSETYLMTMPIIIYNLGGEMIYILCSRLKAQNIPIDKSKKVINDVVSNLFSNKFENEILKHQKCPKHSNIRRVFENLAHSSIMRLNATSMSKLFELMLMSLKLEIVRTRYPEEIYQVTLNHLTSIKDILIKMDKELNKDLIERLENIISRYVEIYVKLNSYDYFILKSTILRFLQGKNVKVSIFIQDGYQDNSSIIYLPMNEVAPPLVKKPGVAKKLDNFGNVLNEFTFELALTNEFQENYVKERNTNFHTELGLNLYSSEYKPKIIGKNKKAKDKTKEFNNIKKIDNNNNNKTEDDTNTNINNITNTSEYPIKNKNKNLYETGLFDVNSNDINNNFSAKDREIINKANLRDYNDLASLLAVNKSNEGTFKIDLFGANERNNSEDDNYIIIEREEKNDIKKKFEDTFKINENKDNNKDEEDDLLDLMDSVSGQK
jgi:hypothetical protein